MTEREKVITGLKCLITDDIPCDGCPYYGSGYCIKNIASDALALLKEQEAVATVRKIEQNEWTVCGVCGQHLIHKWAFCPYCGRPVKWE